ncbi:DUF1934 domain-containing protein [Streptococcus moroccensis]|uniref:Uncharacterized beta-barrel protein YwiB (DUF1934 family) n=1 Tax=Streptococcus moroccensis TaxID=1451356 RepID=A0ABT9YRM9_9STRE|nr:DUF1934 domain-containing protein [Streptococcus moroccensis]MDQ0222655.1 uncharacterized beta-barrel protein YwiB (DUF1934 family) [Streptococcus moroccensis]
MKIHLRNEIQIDEETEIILQTFDVTVQEKKNFTYLIYHNDEGEKVVLKLDQDELVMTRFSDPKSIMRFVRAEDAIVTVPTPMGLQHLVTRTHQLVFDKKNQNVLLHYDLKPLDGNQLFASYQMMISWQ